MQLNELVKNLEYIGMPDNREISSITYDSRKVKAGTLFIAIAGANVDGHDFIRQALEKGAVAILSNGRSPSTENVPVIRVKNPRLAMSKISADFYGNPSREMNIIGITGTNGKTSIAHILSHILNHAEKSCGTIGTLGFNSPTGMVSTSFTTPESVEVQQLLNTLKSAGVNHVVMEISSHALEMHRVDDVAVDTAIFTNLTPEHLDFHGDMENYFQSKLRLFSALNSNNTAVINLDDSFGKRIILDAGAKIISYGMGKNADLYPKVINMDLNGLSTRLIYRKKSISISTFLIGEYNLMNIMASVAAALSKEVSVEKIESAFLTLPAIPGRLEMIPHRGRGKVFIDYAHTPDAYEKLLSNIRNLISEDCSLSVVFGCGGNRDNSKRPKMAEIAENYADLVYLTSDNPRKESPAKIIEELKLGFSKTDYTIIPDRADAIESAMNKMNDNSVLLVLGKGRENYQEIGAEKIPYSDVETIQRFGLAD